MADTVKGQSTLGTYALMVVFAPTLIAGVVAVLSILKVTAQNKIKYNKCVYCSWIFMVFTMALGLLLTTLLFPISVILMEFCNVTTEFFADASFFNQTMSGLLSMSGQINDLSYVCIHGDGDLLGYLGVKEELNNFDIIYT